MKVKKQQAILRKRIFKWARHRWENIRIRKLLLTFK